MLEVVVHSVRGDEGPRQEAGAHGARIPERIRVTSWNHVAQGSTHVSR